MKPGSATGPSVPWVAPAPGAYTRQLRFGEWISEPVTPLFESWLLTRMENALHRQLHAWTGQGAPKPHHVIVNGWYFYSINWLSLGASLRSAGPLLSHILRQPRRVAAMIPPTVRHGIPVYEREWREELQPRYRRTIAEAAQSVEAVPVTALPATIDALSDLAGEYFASIAALAGAAYKMEMNLATFWRRHLAPTLGGSHLPLAAGFRIPASTNDTVLASLDWWFEPVPNPHSSAHGQAHEHVIEARREAEEAATRALAGSPRRLTAFRRLLAETQPLIPIREEQVQELTIAWPVMRRAVVRMGDSLAGRGVISTTDDVFFLTRDEVIRGLDGALPPGSADVAERRALRERQALLVPPLMVGRPGVLLRRVWATFPKLVGAAPSATALVSGAPTSPGRATGVVRVIHGPQQFDTLRPGEVLVAPLTAPAWTPLFELAAAVVTDVGSAAAHASVIAREYGIPAVVGCGDATSRLTTGMRVTVDGSTGNVEAAS